MNDESEIARVDLNQCAVRSPYPVLDADPLSLWAFSIGNSFVATRASVVLVHGAAVMLSQSELNRFDLHQSTFATRDSLIVMTLETMAMDAEPPRQIEVSMERCAFIGDNRSLVRSSGAFSNQRHVNMFRWHIPRSVNLVVGFDRPHQFPSGSSTMAANSFESLTWREFPYSPNDRFIVANKDVSEFWNEPIRSMAVPDLKTLQKLGLGENISEVPGVGANILHPSVASPAE